MGFFRIYLEAHWGDELYKQKKIWMLPFKDVEKDNEGWFVNWTDHPGSIPDPNQVNIGDQVTDMSLNMIPYWTVDHVEDAKIYLKPFGKNPLVTGVGAGGKAITDFDMDVHTGKYERTKVDGILDKWRNGMVFDIRDIAYLLLGTVPLNFGPNGAQGGWYNSSDINSNRGGRKGMDAEEIVKKDAYTIKNVFGFEVPEEALNGTMDSHQWTRYVGGDTDRKNANLAIEKDDPHHMANIAINHSQPSVKLRAAEWLVDYYKYSKSPDLRKIEDPDEFDAMREKKIKGEFRIKDLDNLMRQTGLAIAKMRHPKQGEIDHDPYWHVKEKFIHLARDMGWDDVVDAFEDSPDPDTRHQVLWIHNDRVNADKVIALLQKEKSPLGLYKMLDNAMSTYKKPKDFVIKVAQWVATNETNILKIANTAPQGYEFIKEKMLAYIKHAKYIINTPEILESGEFPTTSLIDGGGHGSGGFDNWGNTLTLPVKKKKKVLPLGRLDGRFDKLSGTSEQTPN